MKRKAIYHERDSRLRVVSLANGLWQAQTLIGSGGGTRTYDPWEPLARPTTLEAALQQLNAHVRG